MTLSLRQPPRRATKVQTVFAAAIPVDVEAISAHLVQCQACLGRWFALLCAADAVRNFLAPRMMTTVVVLVAVGAAITAMA